MRDERMSELFKTMSAEERRARLANEQLALTGQEEDIDTSRFTVADARTAMLRIVSNVIHYNRSVRRGFTGSYKEFVHRTKSTYLE